MGRTTLASASRPARIMGQACGLCHDEDAVWRFDTPSVFIVYKHLEHWTISPAALRQEDADTADLVG